MSTISRLREAVFGHPREGIEEIDKQPTLVTEEKIRSSVEEPTETYTKENVIAKEKVIAKENVIGKEKVIVTEEPVLVSEKKKAPVVKETIVRGEREVIQPVIHRDRIETEIHEVTQPVLQREVLPTKIVEMTLPAETKQQEIHYSAEAERKLKEESEKYKSTTVYGAEHKERIVNQPIIHETVKKNVIEEVQPVIYRETVQPTIIKETKPIYETVIEAPKVTVEVRPPIVEDSVVHKTEMFERLSVKDEEKFEHLSVNEKKFERLNVKDETAQPTVLKEKFEKLN